MEFLKEIWQWLKNNLGWKLAIIAMAAIVIGLIWWNWADIKERPGVKESIERITPIPKPDAQTVTVLVANFADDEDEKYEKLILSALMEIKGIKTKQVNRTVSTDADDQSVNTVIQESGAEIMLWGSVLRGKESDTLQLHWSPEGGGDGGRTGRYVILENQKHYPDKSFYEDLSNVLHLVMLGQYSEIRKLDGSYTADKLLPFIEKATKLLEQEGWSNEARASLLKMLGDSLQSYGEQKGDNKSLEEGIALYRQALTLTPQDRQPLIWAMTQNNLGTALISLGRSQRDKARLEEAVAALKEALKEHKRERVPLAWAGSQNNLGNALSILGERDSDTARLEKAVAAYREALKERTRDSVPLDWAMTQNNLGNALTSLGKRDSDQAWLEEAVAAFKEALKERTRERVPLDWAMTQNNLGNALQGLGERDSDKARLEEAVAVFKEALKEYKRESVPLAWAGSQANLAGAFWAMGNLNGSQEMLCNALGTCLLAWDIYSQAGATHYVSVTSVNIQKVLIDLNGKPCALPAEEAEIYKRYQSPQR